MSTISVVQYQTSPQKLNILQQTHQNNNTNNVIVLRKPPPQHQQQNDILLTNNARKKSSASQRSGDKMTNPPPIAVARRNARERNRVKQVNNGFATLRQHIPNSIAAAFESSNGRGGNKKLSKVETLRMAVEYIRSLEGILAGDDSENSENISTSSATSSTNLSAQMAFSYPIMSPGNEEDDLSSTPSPHSYARTYQIVDGFYENSENLEPLDDNILSDPSLMDAEIDLGNQDLSLLNSMQTTGSLSPEMYSDNSLSPIALDRSSENQMFIPVFNSTNEDIKLRISPELITEIKVEPPVISLSNDNELPPDSKENMIQVMAWWDQQQHSTTTTTRS